jgi:hypothetical protein
LSFNWILDQQCFESLFYEFETEKSEKEKTIKSYKTVEDKHLVKTGFITEIIVGLQKIFRDQEGDKNLKFDHLVSKVYNRVYNIYIRSSFKILELISISLNPNKNEIVFNYNTLKSVKSKFY